jgi:hypothetical protein
VTRLAERPVEAHHVDAAEFMHLMTVGGSKRHSSSRSRRTASLAGFFDLSHVFDGPLRYGASVRDLRHSGAAPTLLDCLRQNDPILIEREQLQ